MEKRGHRFVRYADDAVILCKSKRSAERTLTNILSFIEGKLFLKVNKEKTVVGYVSKIKFLGYGFYVNAKGVRLRVHEKSISRMKERIKLLTSRSNGWGDATRKERLKSFIMGWVNYFKLADMKKLLIGIDEWYRRRLRMVIWKHWKRISTRFRNLLKLGIDQSQSLGVCQYQKELLAYAKSPILHTSITNVRLKQAGYLFFSDYYKTVNDII